MFREMRRFKQQMADQEAIEVLVRGTSGVLAVSGDGDYPYAVPMSYIYEEGKIYFHCAKAGHKTDALLRSDKASFCVIDQDKIVPEKYTTYFRSVIAFGRAKVLTEESEIRHAIGILTRKYSSVIPEKVRLEAIEGGLRNMDIIAMTIEHLTGKEAMELAKEKHGNQ